MTRREFMEALTRAGLATAALAALPPFARSAIAASTDPAPELIVRADWPEHWETSVPTLGRSWLTPNEHFFVRSHFSDPGINLADWRLEITGLVRTPLSLSFEDLRGLRGSELVATLECAGNGRGRYALPSTSGTQWDLGAVGNARWEGVRLATVLERAGVQPEARHVWLEGADTATLGQVPKFLRSIPLEKAMEDVLLARTMNGEPLPGLHGGPLRAVVPGWFGMAWAKWLIRIRVEAAPSDNHFMVKGYRYTYPGEDPTQAPPVEGMQVKSLITRPVDRGRAAPGPVLVQGLAWAGSSGVRMVEVSSDGGANWRPAGFMGEHERSAWRMWATELKLDKPGRYTLMARATDNAGVVQPLEARPNASGYANNSIHRVTVNVRA